MPFGAPLACQKLCDAFVGQPQCCHRAVVVFVEPDLTGVELADPALHCLELGTRVLCAGARLLDVLAQPRDGLIDGFHPGAHGVDLAGQPGQPLAAVGFCAYRGKVGTLGLCGDAIALGQLVAGRGQPLLGLGQLGEQLTFVCGYLVGLGLQRVGIGTAGHLLLGVEVLGPLARDADRRADPFSER
jgi:hypothetical protein